MKNFSMTLLFACICLVSINSATAQQKKQIARDITVLEFNRLIVTKPGTILDVRTKSEVSKGIIKGSIHHDIFKDDFETHIEKLDKTKPVYIYCAVGGRSGEAMEMMNKKGFAEVYSLAGGYNAWIKDQKK